MNRHLNSKSPAVTYLTALLFYVLDFFLLWLRKHRNLCINIVYITSKGIYRTWWLTWSHRTKRTEGKNKIMHEIVGFFFFKAGLRRCCSLYYNIKTSIEYRPIGPFSHSTKQLPFPQPAVRNGGITLMTLRFSIFSNGEALSILYCNYVVVICSGNQSSEIWLHQ